MSVAQYQKLRSRGDTIVEVMIVLAVLGSAISISYATASRSLLNARQAQETSQATVLAQSQIEKLRANSGVTASTAPNYIYLAAGTATPFCINNSGNVSLVPADSTPTPCNQLGEASTGVPYHVAITYNPSPLDTFTVVVSWPDIIGQGNNGALGNGIDTVTLVYRVHQPPAS